MLSKPLFMKNIKSNYKVFLIFVAVLTLYFTMIIDMYDPSTQENMANLLATMPAEFISAFGFDMSNTTLIGFLASYLYGFLVIIFPMIFEILVANRLIARQVDRGSMAYLLATPNTRKKVAITQASFLLLAITILIVYITILGISVSEALFPGVLDIKSFILLNLGVLLLHFTFSGISFFASCVFDDAKNSLLLGAGLPIAFFIIQMLVNVGGKLEDLKYATILTLYNTKDILSGASSIVPSFIALGAIAVVLYTAGIYIFNKRDLSL